MLKTALETPGENEQQRRNGASRTWGFRFFRSPVKILADSDRGGVAGIRLAVNQLEVKQDLFFKLRQSFCVSILQPCSSPPGLKVLFLCVTRAQATEPRRCSPEKLRM